MKLLLAIFLVAPVLGSPCIASADDATVTTNYVLVSGSGEASIVPDSAAVALGVTAKSRVAKSAMDSVNENMHKLMELAKSLHVASEDIQTASISLGQDYSSQTQQLFLASSTVQVTIKDLAKVGDFIGAAVEGGTNTIQNIQFKTSHPETAERTAREIAFKNAQAKANELATLSNRQLGKVVWIEEGTSSDDTPRPQYRMAAMQATSAPVAPGQLQFSITLNVRYELK